MSTHRFNARVRAASGFDAPALRQAQGHGDHGDGQDGGQGDPWAYMAHSWNRLGAPNLIHFPRQMPYPQQYSMVLNATLIQASRLGPPTAQKIKKRLDRDEDADARPPQFGEEPEPAEEEVCWRLSNP